MIISQLNGGLGNQMFEYALGRVLAIQNETELWLDTTPFAHQSYTDTKRRYELRVFGVPARVARRALLEKFGKPNKYKILLNRYFHLHMNPYPTRYIREDGHEFHKEVLGAKGDTYLSGYWQSEKYFRDFRETIQGDFAKRLTPLSPRNAKIRDLIQKTQSVSLHVRRTDYITNKNANKYHGTCDLAYYRKAMRYIEKQVRNPTYFVFSDDPTWVKTHITSPHRVIYVTHNNGSAAHEDLRLMQLCQSNIIANSSFSWWGAWLNNNPAKIVIAPKRWVADPTVSTKDLLPKPWIKI